MPDARPRTWQVKCSRCHRPKWPYQAERPGVDWVCALCLATTPEASERRRRRAAKAQATRRGKSPAQGRLRLSDGVI